MAATVFPGVSASVKKNGEIYYRASLTYRQKHISLGSYENAETAHRAYLEGIHLLSDASVTLVKYGSSCILPFEKWVVLLNFRDNGIYFNTPIYMGQKMIFYYLSPTHVLKFDLDDLFYYSSHKIMQRGNHYFVADYGMQVNLASRYGIKNYGVAGTDYLFKNGDTTDFRRENIEIINPYQGVRMTKKENKTVYSVYIHIRGNHLVGYYETILEAAIAYNKAIDILKKNGLTKNFVPNYIEKISAKEYAEIYSKVSVHKNISNYFSV